MGKTDRHYGSPSHWIARGFTEKDAIDRSNLFKERVSNSSKRRKEYWINLGFSDDEATIKVSEIQRSCSKRCVEYWLKKGHTESESEELVIKYQRETSKRCVEYWLKKGYTESDALHEMVSYQSKCGVINAKKSLSDHRKASPRCKEYWIERGLSSKDSMLAVREAQNICAKDSFISRHGMEEGELRYVNFINKQKYIHTIDYFNDVFGEEYGELKYKESIENRNKNIYVSKISQELFDGIYKQLSEDHKQHCYYSSLNKEFGKMDLSDRKYKFYDFVLSNIKLCIEFNGDFWHGNPSRFGGDDYPLPQINKTASEMWEFDKKKHRLLESNGYEIFIIWESEYKKSKEDVINRCLIKIEERTNEIKENN